MIENCNDPQQMALWTVVLKKEHVTKREECRKLKTALSKVRNQELDYADLKKQLESQRLENQKYKREMKHAQEKVSMLFVLLVAFHFVESCLDNGKI